MISEFTAAVEDLLWLAVLALLAGAAVFVVSKRGGADARTTISRMAATWLVLALVGVWYLTLTPIGDVGSHPGSSIDLFAHIDARNAVVNVGLFFPVGFLARIVWGRARRPVTTSAIFCVAVSLVIEGTQWVAGLGRSADIQDFALNTLGGLAGVAAASGVFSLASGSRIDSPAALAREPSRRPRRN